MNFFAKNPFLFWLSLIFVLITIINPVSSIDLLFLLIYLFIIGQKLLKEKMLLIFLLIRPTLDYWRDYEIFHFQEKIINLNSALAILFFLWAGYNLWIWRKKIPKKTPFYFFLLFSLLTLISSLYSISPFNTIAESIKFLDLGLFFFLAFVFSKNKIITKKLFLGTFALSAVIPILFSIIQIFTGSGLDTFGIHGRIYGTFAHPNVLAFFILFLLFLFLQFTFFEPNKFWKENKKIRLITLISLLFLLLMTYTRISIIALILFLFIIILLKKQKTAIMYFVSFLFLLSLFFPLVNYLQKNTDINPQNSQLIARLTSRDEDADSIAWRLALIRESIPIISYKPLFGYGYGTFPLVWSENRNESHLWDDSAEAHNDYLRITLELGTVGLVLYIIFLLTLLKSFYFNIKNPKTNNVYIFAWLIAFAIISLSDNMLHHTAPMWLMWTWLGANYKTSVEEK